MKNCSNHGTLKKELAGIKGAGPKTEPRGTSDSVSMNNEGAFGPPRRHFSVKNLFSSNGYHCYLKTVHDLNLQHTY